MKRVMVIAAILGIGYASKAQTVSFGPTGGVVHSYINNADGTTKFNPSWNAGLSLIYSTASNFGVGVDVRYSTEGNKVRFQTPGPADGLVDATGVINANYVRVPLKAIYFFSGNKSTVRPKIYAGPSFGFLTDANSKTIINGSTIKDNIQDELKSFDFGITAGAGLNFKVAPRTWLNTDLAFYQGLTDMSKNDNRKLHNANLGVNLGLLVGLGK